MRRLLTFLMIAFWEAGVCSLPRDQDIRRLLPPKISLVELREAVSRAVRRGELILAGKSSMRQTQEEKLGR
ncbi:MAG: hypothetical protein ACYDBT_11395 [Desulfobulbaceae bacterium]